MNETFVLDACALIAFLSDEPGADLVENLLENADKGTHHLVIHKINLLEIYYGVYRDDGYETADMVLRMIKKLPVQIISSLSDEVFLEAGQLKAQHKLSLADSIAVAESNIREARLVTADHHELDALEKLKKVRPYWIR
ncbi:MAG: PIN domain-containing protein [Candidatus Electrothrix sp. Rat3]|nr:PIN domain-containing protein [Candidatus Electrothrix rattekaaiensis]